MTPKVIIPDGTPQWPDVEKAMVTLLSDLQASLTPSGYACVVLPEDAASRQERGQVIAQVQRAGGFANRTQDNARITLNIHSYDRSVSWDVLGWLRPQLHQFEGVVTNSDGTVAIVQDIEDTQGPQRTPAQQFPSTVVQCALTVTTRIER